MESPFTLIPVPSVLVCLQVHREIMPLYRRGGSLWIAPSGANPDGLKRKKQDQNRQQDRYSDSHNSTHCLTQQGAGSRQTCASACAETGTPALGSEYTWTVSAHFFLKISPAAERSRATRSGQT